MPSHVCLSIQLLHGLFHGRGEGGHPEWPPSPLRAFQAIVWAAAAKGRLSGIQDYGTQALSWLEALAAPSIVTGQARLGTPYRVAVPNNDLDVVAAAWSKGKEPARQPSEMKTLKTVRPVRLLDDHAINYMWSVPQPASAEVEGHIKILADVASSIVALGWGVDVAVGNLSVPSDLELRHLDGVQWAPLAKGGDDGLRIPISGTLADLGRRYHAFLARVGAAGYATPPRLSVFERVKYRRITEVPQRPTAAFSLLRLDGSGFRPFDTVRKGLTVAGMARHAVRRAAERAGWPESKVNAFVLGHAKPEDEDIQTPAAGPNRFAYLPLPSLEARAGTDSRVVGSVRRLLLTVGGGVVGTEIDWARRAISGQELVDEHTGEVLALMSLVPTSDQNVTRYLIPASTWATVTPVVLPGYDDPAHLRRRLERCDSAVDQQALLTRLAQRTEALLRKAIVQAGFPQMLAEHADLEWRTTGFWPGSELASRYGVPDHLARFSRCHVRLTWRDADGQPIEVPGPVCVGGGRYYGIGLFAAMSHSDQRD